MKNLREKMKKQNGFTLIEMLIVVAIIAILVAVSIPLIGSSLEKARQATDAANERAAKAEMLLCYMTDASVDVDEDEVWYYDAVNGTLVTSFTGSAYGKCGTHSGSYIAACIHDGIVYIKWTSGTIDAAFTASDTDLCSSKVNN